VESVVATERFDRVNSTAAKVLHHRLLLLLLLLLLRHCHER
jgi:hypothetical protein